MAENQQLDILNILRGITTYTISDCKDQFTQTILTLENMERFDIRAISVKRLQNLIESIQDGETRLYYYASNYHVLGSQLLDRKERLVVPLEKMFEICLQIHQDTGYQNRTLMEQEGKTRYSNLTRTIMDGFLAITSNCAEYQTIINPR